MIVEVDSASTVWTAPQMVYSQGCEFQIFITGVVGIYVDKCIDEAKKKPAYFVCYTSNL